MTERRRISPQRRVPPRAPILQKPRDEQFAYLSEPLLAYRALLILADGPGSDIEVTAQLRIKGVHFYDSDLQSALYRFEVNGLLKSSRRPWSLRHRMYALTETGAAFLAEHALEPASPPPPPTR